MSQFVITRRIVVAGGVFAPGHLGELTRIVPFEMVDAVLADCGAVQRRVRKLPARVVTMVQAAGRGGRLGRLVTRRDYRSARVAPAIAGARGGGHSGAWNNDGPC